MNTKVQSFLLALVLLASMFSDSEAYFPARVGRKSSIEVSIFILKNKKTKLGVSGRVKLLWNDSYVFQRFPNFADYQMKFQSFVKSEKKVLSFPLTGSWW